MPACLRVLSRAASQQPAAMAVVPCVVLHRSLGAAAALGGGCRMATSISATPIAAQGQRTTPLSVRAAKNAQPPPTMREREEGRAGGGGRKGDSFAEKSMYSGGKGGRGVEQQQASKKNASTRMEVELKNMTAFPGPKPPAGFILDEAGAVVLVAPADRRIVTIVDPASQRPLECMIRRAFQSSDGRDCLLLLPLDMPLQILKIDEEREGLIELSDDELQEVLPSAVYALAKRRLHLIVSGFCLTARGGFCYTEEHVLDFKAEYGEGLGGSLTEGVEIANFQMDNSEYIIYTPFDPVIFVVHRDEATGTLKIADDELLDDEIVLDAIDEENEFQALVDEEEAMHETLREAK